MDDYNQEELDALFQEGSERYDFTYREDAWASMDGMLEGQEKKRKKRLFGWWIVVGLAALAGVFGLKHFTSNHESLGQNDQLEQNIRTTQANTPTTNTESADFNERDQISITATTENKNIETTNTIGQEMEAVTPTDLPRKLSNKILENNDYAKSQSSAPVESFYKTGENTLLETPKIEAISTSPENIAPSKQERMISTVTQPVRSEHTYLLELPSGKLSFLVDNSDRLSSIHLPAITLENKEVAIEDEKPKFKNRFSVGLTAGPEFSFVGGTGEAKAGYYLGVELGYQISNHFELIAGVGVSKKRYLGDGANYKTEPGFWTDEIVPMEFAGKCTVIEIPVAVNYYFKDANESGWFTSLGATTYLMSSEWYDFIYDPSINRTDLKANWNDKMANNHLLGVGQISFGYQYKFGKHTSLQISPYAKIPLTGIGNGSVNLFSTGLRLTARFK